MSHARRFDHVGITVADLDTVTAFFVGLGLEVKGRTVEGEFLDTVIGILDFRTEIVMLLLPEGGTGLELSSFVRPDHDPGSPAAMANELGLRNVAFEVPQDVTPPPARWVEGSVRRVSIDCTPTDNARARPRETGVMSRLGPRKAIATPVMVRRRSFGA
jgi:catechol 2,3-dioxygenase-like lactoylglutathione lyase family enzyme